MADAQAWETPDADSAIRLAAELSTEATVPSTLCATTYWAISVIVPDDSPGLPDAVAFLAGQEGLRRPRPWMSPTHPGYIQRVLGNRDWAGARARIIDYQGLSLDDALRRAETEDRPYRVIAPGDFETLEAIPVASTCVWMCTKTWSTCTRVEVS
jgi:hypothetical protein